MLTRESGTSFSDARLTSVEFVDVFILYNMFNGSKKNAFHLIGKPPHRKLVFRFCNGSANSQEENIVYHHHRYGC